MSSFTNPVHPGEHSLRVKVAQHALTAGGNVFRIDFAPGPVDGAWGVRNEGAANEARYELGYRIDACHSGIFGQALYAYLRGTAKLPASYKARRLARRGKHLAKSIPGTATACARLLLEHEAAGRYHADNPGDLNDVRATAQGRKVWSQGGYWVAMDRRPLAVLLHLIDAGYAVGTFALCSDHHDDGPHGHAGGKAVDISSIRRVSVMSEQSRALVIQVDKLLRSAPGLRPRQLITGGYGSHRDSTISNFSIPGADGYYGSKTMSQHCNHIHVGY